jgi:hypothetical protein
MTELSPQFEQSLARLVRQADEREPDWADVLERATRARRHSLLIFALAAFCLAAGVSAAFAFGPQLWRIVGGKPVKPAALSADERELLAAISSGRPPLRTQPDSPQVRALGKHVSIRLLAKRDSYTFYLIQVRGRRHQTCVATGRTGVTGRSGAPQLFGSLSCPLEPLFPSARLPIYDQSVWGQNRGEPFRVFRLEGFAADGIAKVGLLVGDQVVATVPVVDNTYLRATGLPKQTPRAVVAIDRSGHRFYCAAGGPCSQRLEDLEQPLPRPHKPPRQTPPSPFQIHRHRFSLGRHLQHGAANGVTVDVYAPGAAVFDTVGLSPRTKRLLTSRIGASYSCMRVRFYHGKWLEDGSGTNGPIWGRFRLDLKFDVGRASISPDLPPPYDACEIGGYYGHRWNDANGARAAVEVPLTAAGRRFFNDRAAARDLAYFVRSGRVQRIRLSASPRPQLEALTRRFPRRVLELHSAHEFGPQHTIGFWVGSQSIRFTTTSSTGRHFLVVAERRTLRLPMNNLGDLAFVF